MSQFAFSATICIVRTYVKEIIAGVAFPCQSSLRSLFKIEVSPGIRLAIAFRQWANALMAGRI